MEPFLNPQRRTKLKADLMALFMKEETASMFAGFAGPMADIDAQVAAVMNTATSYCQRLVACLDDDRADERHKYVSFILADIMILTAYKDEIAERGLNKQDFPLLFEMAGSGLEICNKAIASFDMFNKHTTH